MTGASNQGIKTVLHPVSDVDAAKAVYSALLGIPPQTDSAYYAGYEFGGRDACQVLIIQIIGQILIRTLKKLS